MLEKRGFRIKHEVDTCYAELNLMEKRERVAGKSLLSMGNPPRGKAQRQPQER
jgi:hypothetical protein